MLFLFLIIAAAIVFHGAKNYNLLQVLAQGVREGHSNVIAAMKKRIDLTNKLIDIATGYADHEKLTHISLAQSEDGQSMGGAGVAASGAITQVLRLATMYPDLKANATYQQLMGQLDRIEADLQDKREAYNSRVRTYNSALVKLPVSLYAKQLGFKSASYFDVDNADSLENLKSFHSDDAEHLKEMFAQGGRKLADGSRKFAEESVRFGKNAMEKGKRNSANSTSGDDVSDNQGLNTGSEV